VHPLQYSTVLDTPSGRKYRCFGGPESSIQDQNYPVNIIFWVKCKTCSLSGAKYLQNSSVGFLFLGLEIFLSQLLFMR
jgi:hypothetical protein